MKTSQIMKTGARVKMNTWAYGIPLANTSSDRLRGRASLIKRGASVKIHRIEGDIVIVRAKCSELGAILAPVAVRDITLKS